MKTPLRISLLFLILFSTRFTQAQSVVFTGQYSNEAIVHVENGVIFKGQYGNEAIAHIEGKYTDVEWLPV